MTKQKLLNSVSERDRYTCGCVTYLGFRKDRGSLLANVEVMDEEIIKVLGKECRERG